MKPYKAEYSEMMDRYARIQRLDQHRQMEIADDELPRGKASSTWIALVLVVILAASGISLVLHFSGLIDG
jgi:hypothetical protein